MSDKLTEAMESVCKIAEKVADRKSHDGFSLPLGYLKDVVRPVLKELCGEIDRWKSRHESNWETIREYAALKVKQQEEIDRLTAENKQQENTMSDRLKPCPFCGEKHLVVLDYSRGIYHVQCKKCYASSVFGKKVEATAAWNRRSNHESPAFQG